MQTEIKELVENTFTERMKTIGVKYDSKTFFNKQCEFFCGAMAALQDQPPHWVISIMASRSIVKPYEL